MLRFVAVPLVFGLALSSAYSSVAALGVWPASGALAPDKAADAARIVLAKAPLDAPSFYTLGIAADRAKQTARARALVARSMHYDPRFRPTRLWLLVDSVRGGRTGDAIEQALALTALSPRAAPAVSAMLAQLALDPNARKEIGSRLRNRPLILQVARATAQLDVSSDALLDLLRPSDLATIRDGIETAQSLVAQQMLSEGRPREARAAWYSLSGLSPRSEVFDGSFRGLAGAPPFGWTFHNNTDVQVGRVHARGPERPSELQVTAYGSLPVLAAEQTLALRRGKYQLDYMISSPIPEGTAGSFTWTVSCKQGTVLIEADVAPARSRGVAQAGVFVVPEQCPVQVLKLSKLRTGDGAKRELRVSQVAIAPA